MNNWSNINIKTFGFFLLLAFGFLLVTKLSKKYTETIEFQIELVNTPDDMYFNQDSLPTISATVTSRGFNYLANLFNQNVITLDFETLFSIRQNLAFCPTSDMKHLIASNIGLTAIVEGVKPDTLSISYSKLISKVVPVKLQSDFKFSAGYKIYNGIEVKPDSVTVIGAFNVVGEINFVETAVIEKKDIANTFNETVVLLNPNTTAVKMKPSQVKLHVPVEKYTENVVSVPIDFIGLPKDVNVNYFPKSVDVFFEVSLKDAENVVPELFEVVCNYNSLSSTNESVITPLIYKQPNFVKNARLKLKEVEFIIIE